MLKFRDVEGSRQGALEERVYPKLRLTTRRGLKTEVPLIVTTSVLPGRVLSPNLEGTWESEPSRVTATVTVTMTMNVTGNMTVAVIVTVV